MDKEARSMDIKTILNPKVWLIITGVMHALAGVLAELDMGNETKVVVSALGTLPIVFEIDRHLIIFFY